MKAQGQIVRVTDSHHRSLKIEAAETGRSIREILTEILDQHFGEAAQ